MSHHGLHFRQVSATGKKVMDDRDRHLAHNRERRIQKQIQRNRHGSLSAVLYRHHSEIRAAVFRRPEDIRDGCAGPGIHTRAELT